MQIAMYEDRIEMNSPGGLPVCISKEECLTGNISVLRNPIIAGIFNRLNIIEKFGTGIARINKGYANRISKPDFEVSKNRIRIVLPVIESTDFDLSKDELVVYELLKEHSELSRKDIGLKTGFEKAKTLRIINRLVDKSVILKSGNGPAVTYILK